MRLILKTCLGPIYEALVATLSQSHSRAGRGQRNDLVTLIFLLVKHAQETDQLTNIRVVETGIVRLLCQLFTLKRSRHINPLLKNFKLLPNPENFDFIKLIISSLALLIHDPAAVRVMGENHLMDALFDWAWLMHFSPTRISKTPRPSLTCAPNPQVDPEHSAPAIETNLPSNSGTTECSSPSNTSDGDGVDQVQRTISPQTKPVSDSVETGTISAKSSDSVTENVDQEEEHDDDNEDDDDDDDDETTESNLSGERKMADLQNMLGALAVNQGSCTNLDPIKRWPMAFQEEMQLHTMDALTSIGPALL
ncbi:unnamed protein product, partial [Echinostoma caproni]|uniref:DUF4704 domain-containing protein n=1 Tax=Echinostoma caproni TaxID=27848 RepID=A0A183B6R2_9TREM